LQSENAYTESIMDFTTNLQNKLYAEFVGRIKETDSDVPTRIDDYEYYSRTEAGKEYHIHCRRRVSGFSLNHSQDPKEEIILDENLEAKGKSYFRLGAFEISPNHSMLVYSFDATGSETYILRVKDLTSGELLEDEISNVYCSVEWANDNCTFFYSILDDAKRPYKLFRHILGRNADLDESVFHESDEAFYLSLSKTRSKKYLLLKLKSNTTSEVHYLDADHPNHSFRVIEPRRSGVEYDAHHCSDRFFIRTNDRAKNFRLMEAPLDTPSREHWEEIIPHDDKTLFDEVSVFQNYLVIWARVAGLESIRILDFRSGKTHEVKFEEPTYSIRGAWNPEFNSATLRFSYESLTTPCSIFDYDMETRTRDLRKRYEVPGDYDPANYVSERILATGEDGVQVPISLVYSRGFINDGPRPLLLYAYGSYGIVIDADFSSARLSLLDRGFVYAIAHVRGGEDLGRCWYDQGKLLHKRNTFKDFIAVAEHLIKNRYTDPKNLVIQGGSAGGLLVGAVLNMRPDLFHAAIAKVPFVDVINTMLDSSIPLTVTEYEEWGDPNKKAFYDYILSYSPYDNVVRQNYPHLLVTAGLNDPRVQYWEPAKWTARLRALKADNNLLLLKTKMHAGHGGSSGRYEHLHEKAFEYAFLLSVLGVGE
jgi:oligopeptidase B